MKKKNKIHLFFLYLSLLLVVCIVFIPKWRAFVIMSFSSQYEENQSDLPIKLKIPTNSDEDWFPKMMVYHDKGGFNKRHNQEVDLTIFYNFGNFKGGRSTIFDPSSPYYSSFYGAYVINESATLFEESMTLQDITKIPDYDYRLLILHALGLSESDSIFEINGLTAEPVAYLGEEGWTQCDMTIQTMGMYHTPVKFKQHYLQFGKPERNRQSDFLPLEMKGRVYYKYYEEIKTTLALYIITSSEDLLNQTDRHLLSKSEIQMINQHD